MAVTQKYKSRVLARKYVEKQALALRPGEALPPIRAMVKESGVSRNHIQEVIQQMEQSNVLIRKHRQGIFRGEGETAPAESRVVNVIACSVVNYLSARGTFYPSLLEALSTNATSRNFSVKIHSFAPDAPMSDFALLASQADIDTCILLGQHEQEIGRIFEQNHVRFVSVFPRMPLHSDGEILDSPEMTEIQLAHLFELGHRRIVYVDPMEERFPAWCHIVRRENYYRIMAEHGYRVDPNWVVPMGVTEADLFGSLDRAFSESPYPTAIIVSDSKLGATYRFIERFGLQVGKDVSVIGIDDLDNAVHMSPPATSVRNSRLVISEMIMDAFEHRLTGKGIPKVQYVPLELIVRESTGPATGTEECNI